MESLLQQHRQSKTQPDFWLTFNSTSMLGEALLGQKKYKEAESLLLAGYKGMNQRKKTIPPQGKIRLIEALQRLINLYEATGKKEEAEKWRRELELYQPAKKPRAPEPPLKTAA